MTRAEKQQLKEQTKQIENVIKGVFRGDKVVCLSSKSINGKAYCEWAVVNGITQNCDAVFATASDIYSIKYLSASGLKKLALLDERLFQLK